MCSRNNRFDNFIMLVWVQGSPFHIAAESHPVQEAYRGAHLYFRLDIILVKGLSKHTLNEYFSGVKIDPKYVFLHAFFLICPSCPFQNLSLWPKTHQVSNFAHFCTPKRCAYIAWSWKTTLITWFFFFFFFFYEEDIQLQIQVAPSGKPGGHKIVCTE